MQGARKGLGFFIALTLGQQRWIKTLGIGHGEVLGDTTAGLAPAVARTEVTGAFSERARLPRIPMPEREDPR